MLNNLRPKSLDGIVGQEHIVKRLRISLKAIQMREGVFAHALFSGPPGLGKTTFSEIIAHEMGAELQTANGANVRSIKSIIPYLMRIKPKSVLFIDEIHRLTKLVEEFLYPVMEDFKADVGKDDKGVSVDIPQFTLVGATTKFGALSAPFRDRFTNKYTLDFYEVCDIIKLLKINAGKLSINLTDEVAEQIAMRSRGTPRIANNLLKWLGDFCLASSRTVDSEATQEAMKLVGVDEKGLNDEDRKYLECLTNAGREIGLQTIESMTGIEEETITDTIEPYLIRLGLIMKTTKGRMLI